ncbi:hypothetical protein [Natrinema hispanicum]|nr:hypothetical protein [Natrinema hispanicum]
MSADIGNHRSDSFNNHRVSWSTSETGAWLFATDMGTAIDARSLSATYFISAGNDYLNVSAWNTSDGNNGMASAYGLEYVDSKFWNDGQDPWAFWQGDSYHDRMQTGYGWNSYISDSPSIEYLGTSIGNIESGDWGIINPDSTDDTFFFRRPTIYQTNSQTVPVAFLEDAIPNDKQEGAAHGDIVTYDATDYRIMQQSGAGKSNTISVGLRYE